MQQDQQADLLFYAAEQVNKLSFSSFSRWAVRKPQSWLFLGQSLGEIKFNTGLVLGSSRK